MEAKGFAGSGKVVCVFEVFDIIRQEKRKPSGGMPDGSWEEFICFSLLSLCLPYYSSSLIALMCLFRFGWMK